MKHRFYLFIADLLRRCTGGLPPEIACVLLMWALRLLVKVADEQMIVARGVIQAARREEWRRKINQHAATHADEER